MRINSNTDISTAAQGNISSIPTTNDLKPIAATKSALTHATDSLNNLQQERRPDGTKRDPQEPGLLGLRDIINAIGSKLRQTIRRFHPNRPPSAGQPPVVPHPLPDPSSPGIKGARLQLGVIKNQIAKVKEEIKAFQETTGRIPQRLLARLERLETRLAHFEATLPSRSPKEAPSVGQ